MSTMSTISVMEMYVCDDLNGREKGPSIWEICLSNGKTIEVEKEPLFNGSKWAWRVEDQFFGDQPTALLYLRKVIEEKLTGKRIILRAKKEIPEICGVNGVACRNHNYNSGLCIYCPVAERALAERDGVELIYALSASKKEEKI